MAKKGAVKKSAAGKSREVLVVASKVKAYVKKNSMNTSSDAIAQLSDRVYCLIDEATSRTRANGRKTLKPQDI
ncbi:MAG: hypothetical protein HOP29_09505 [Phycisphaerales bacterium]|nr:hypothetical protein [Phycisphaerales bacterium]